MGNFNELEAVDLDRATIGLLCKKERTRLGKTQEELSDERISVSTISLIERGVSHVSEDTVKYYVEKLRLTEQIYNTMSPTRREEENTKKRLYDIESLISAIDPETALRRLNELEIQTYNRPYLEYIKGRCYFEMHDLKNSKKHFTNAIKIYNHVIHEIQELRKTNILAASENELSRIYYYENNLQKALEHADKGIQSYVNGGERPNTRFYLYVNKAMYLERLDKNEDALACIESLENTTKPEEQDIYQVSVKIIVHVRIKLSKILYKLHLYKKAQVKAEEGLKIARANSLFSEIFTLQSILGDIYKGQANIKKAIYHYQTALEFKKYLDKNPELIDVYLNLGEIYMNIDKQQAKRYLKKAVDLSKDYHELSIESLNKLGIYYISQKKYEKALRTFQKALDVKETKETLYNICLIYKKQNKNIELLQFAYKYFT